MNNPSSFAALLPLLLLTVLGGAALPVQAGINARLGRELGSPLFGALMSFLVGTISLILVILLTRAFPTATGASVAKIPAWVWVGGLIGAVYVTLALLAAPRLGFALFTAAAIAGQLLTSLVLDHFGLLGVARQPMTMTRLLGVALLIAGIALIRRPASP